MKQQIMRLTAILIFGAFYIGSANAGAYEKKLLLFHANVTQDQIDAFVSEWEAEGTELVDLLPFINGAVLNVPDTIPSESLADDPRVLVVEDDQPMKLQATPPNDGDLIDAVITPLEGNPILGNQIPWGIVHLYDMPYDPFTFTTQMKSSNTPELVDEARAWANITNLRVAIFDTGVDAGHPKLGKLVKEGRNFLDTTISRPFDDNGHGTHVAATLVGYKLGLARGCEFYSAKVLDANAEGEVSTLVSALQWAIDKKINLINMSIAFKDDHPAVHAAIKAAHGAGIVMIAAVGNHSNWENDETASGEGGAGEGGAGEGGAAGDDTSANPYPVMFPAAYPEVIAVGAHDSLGELTSFSNVGPEMDLTAPGKDVLSANRTDISQYGVCSGTSMATPHVSGTVALMMALDEGHNLSTAEIRDILTTTAIDGRLNLTGALEEVHYRYLAPPEQSENCTVMFQNADGTTSVVSVPCN